MNEVINELNSLYRNIDICQTDILHARLHKNRESEDLALDKNGKADVRCLASY